MAVESESRQTEQFNGLTTYDLDLEVSTTYYYYYYYYYCTVLSIYYYY